MSGARALFLELARAVRLPSAVLLRTARTTAHSRSTRPRRRAGARAAAAPAPATFAAACAAALLAGCASSPRADAVTKPAETARALPAPAWERIGASVEGRAIEALTIGGGAGRPRILLVGGIHGDEPEGGRTINAVVAYLATLRPDATVRIVRDANPDGAAAGTRVNARGVDLNRNWPASNFRSAPARGQAPLSEPETRVLLAEIERFDPDLILVCHSSVRGPFVNFDGPGAAYAVAFASGAARGDRRWRIVPDMGYATPGSLGSFAGVDGGIPILTLEFARGHDADGAWTAMRDGLRAVLERGVPAK